MQRRVPFDRATRTHVIFLCTSILDDTSPNAWHALVECAEEDDVNLLLLLTHQQCYPGCSRTRCAMEN